LSELQEDNFIQEGYGKNPSLLWFWSIIVAMAIVLIEGVNFKTAHIQSEQLRSSPFLRVTNREFSLFLWQYPHFMRVHAKNKIGYLPGFQYLHKVNMELAFSEEHVVTPPTILFLYHTWNRLLYSYYPSRPITQIEFNEFLSVLPEWQPDNWMDSPEEYKTLVESLKSMENQSLERLSLNELPVQVRHAFYGWKNFFKEGDLINAFNPTFLEMDNFLKQYPNYRKNFWQNIESEYLKSLSDKSYVSEGVIPQNEIPAFLRVAIYNHTKSLDHL
jgi:hypothetical protein